MKQNFSQKISRPEQHESIGINKLIQQGCVQRIGNGNSLS